jgi:hypothetical protein
MSLQGGYLTMKAQGNSKSEEKTLNGKKKQKEKEKENK